jgi:hypothetical protein
LPGAPIFGEAPFTLELRAPSPGHWQWSFGDGRTGRGEEVDADSIARWDGKLKQALRSSLGSGSKPGVRIDALRGSFRLERIGRDGRLAVSRSGMTLKLDWSRLSLADRANVALAVVREGNEGDHAAAGFYLRASGRDREAARHLARAGAAADEVRRAFAQWRGMRT